MASLPADPQIRWWLRRVRPILRPPLVAARHRGLRASDVFIAEYPKSGSTWLTFMLGELLFGQPMDFEVAPQMSPGVGSHRAAPVAVAPDGRLLRTHERYRGEYRRGIYVVRHVADVAVSYYNHLLLQKVRRIEFKDFLQLLLRGRIDGYGSWADHVNGWLDAPVSTVHVVRYEDLHRDPHSTLIATCRFLGREFGHDAVDAAVTGNALDRMRKKESAARHTVLRNRQDGRFFVRRGAVGDSNLWLDREDFAIVERYAGGALRRLGYATLPEAGPVTSTSVNA